MRRCYFDHNASTPVAAGLLAALPGVMAELSGNASSLHQDGQAARRAVDAAREQVAQRLGGRPKEIVFTSGGTEADNLAVLGVVRADPRQRKHVVTTAIEHPAVLEACAHLEREGVAVSYVMPQASGVIDTEAVRRQLRPETVLVSVMHANNETGAVQPLAEIARLCRDAGVLLHSDGVQVPGRQAVDVTALGVDLYAISGHKLNAPKGVGALWVREGVNLQPSLFGGRHERQRRAGTENVPGIWALGFAADREPLDCAALRDRLEDGVLARVPAVTVNSQGVPRLGNTSNLCFDGVSGEAMVIALDLRGFSVSTGSACSSGSVEPSHVLLAMGMPPDRARASVRVSLGEGNTAEQVDALVEAVAESAAHLRRLSPAYSHA